MPRKPRQEPRGPNSLFARFLSKRNQELAERLEEREWRRRMVIASRRIQELHENLDDDLTDVRGLKAHVEGARPEMERLEASLASSREVFDKLHYMLERHAELMSERVDAAEDEVDRQAHDTERLQQLEEELGRKDAAVTELLAQLSEQREAIDRAQQRTAELEEQARTAFLREEQQRLAKEELEEAAGRFEDQIDGLQELLGEVQRETSAERQREAEHTAKTLELEGRIEDLTRMRDEAETRALELETTAAERLDDEERRARVASGLEQRVEELVEARVALEARLRDSEIKRLEAETKGQQELTDFADHSRQRQSELEARLRSSEQEVTALRQENEQLEQRIANLNRRVQEFDSLQEAMRASSRDLEARTSQLLDLMRGDEDGQALVPTSAQDAVVEEPREPLPDVESVQAALPEPPTPLDVFDELAADDSVQADDAEATREPLPDVESVQAALPELPAPIDALDELEAASDDAVQALEADDAEEAREPLPDVDSVQAALPELPTLPEPIEPLDVFDDLDDDEPVDVFGDLDDALDQAGDPFEPAGERPEDRESN